MHLLTKFTPLGCALSLLCLPGTSSATHLSTTNNQGSTATTGWNASIWKTNSAGNVNLGGTTLVGPAVGPPVAGNTYSCVSNGVVFSANSGNTIIRNPFATGTTSPQTFPGDSLTLFTNTEIRFKRVSSGNVPICNFPGVGGNPGLILNGGLLNGGDDETYPITGLIRVDSQSYFALGANGGQAPTSTGRRFNVSAQITGSGNLVFFNGSNRVAQVFSGTNDTYSGQWILKSAWVQANGTNSLGTNSTILVDPYYVLPLDPGIVDVPGPAEIEIGYDINSAGTLTLINGGRMRLHQNCCFTAVTIEGTALEAGTHFYSELVSNFPNVFRTGGSGAITVQPYGTPPVLGPAITTQPLPQMLYAGRPAHFTVVAIDNGAPPLSYAWRMGGVPLTDGPTGSGSTISGSTNNTLTISNVSAADAGSYDVVVSNPGGSVPSAAVALSIVATSGEAYEAAVIAANPYAFYQLNETGDPVTNNTLAFDYVGGYNALYGTAVLNGNPNYNIAGPSGGAGFPGFANGNLAAQFAGLTVGSRITTVAPWNLSNNIVTITAWINPAATPALSAGLICCRGGGTGAGLNYSPSTDANGNTTLAYTWNNEPETLRWYSGLVAPPGQWSFVALVVTPTNATIHLMNTNGLASATRAYAHAVQAFGVGSTTTIGDDSQAADGSRVFNGIIDDVAVFANALSKDQLFNLFTNASGMGNYAPIIAAQPTNEVLYAGQTAQFSVVAGGTDPLTYQWQAGAAGSGVYTNLVDSGKISGSTGPTLTISAVADTDAADFVVTIANGSGSVTSSVANLYVQAVSAAENITMVYFGTTTPVLQPSGTDWNTGNDWSDGNPASLSAVMKPGSTYELLPSGGLNIRMRTPENATVAVFPGDVLTVDGNGVWVNDPGSNGVIAEIRFKQPTAANGTDGTVIFKKLVMNGGQLDSGNPGVIVIGGEIDILTNTPFYNDNSADRGYRIDAWLTGGSSSSIEYHGYNRSTWQSNYVRNLNIAGTSNTFSGKWNVVLGTLLGTGPNSLGTNDIVVGPNGALETTYDINNTNANLFLSGRMYLHQNDTFKSLFVNGVPLAVGSYTFAQLNAAYPTNFPAAWAPQIGATNFTAGSGAITVLVQPAPTILLQPVSLSKYPTETAQFTVGAQGSLPLYHQWRKGGTNLSDTGNISGALTTNLAIANITTGDGGDYDVVVTNSVGSVTSLVATLTILPTFPATNLTLNYGGAPVVQATGQDWNTTNCWIDGNPASLSALQFPGSTYEVVAGARLRSPASAAYSLFPGDVLTVDGDGVYVNNGSATIGEIRFKHANPGTNYFKRLVMNGGQLDSGDNGLMVIQGRMDVLANTPIYADSGAGQDRPYQIDAWLTGSGGIEFHQYGNTFAGNLNVTGTTNTYSGRWNIVQGCVLGSGPNCLGTNSITVGANGALETLYDLNSPNANLFLDGQLFLHQNDTFGNVVVGGVWLAPGTYTFGQLNAAYPANFPASWPQQSGSTFLTGSGSLVVLRPSLTLSALLSGSSLQLTWPQGTLLEATNLDGPWTPVSGATPPSYTVMATDPQRFFRVQLQ